MKSSKYNVSGLFFILFIAMLVTSGCEQFMGDGNNDTLVAPAGGFFYITERQSNSIIMLDAQLTEVKRWSLAKICSDSSAQGITIDGKNIWVSCAGSVDGIKQLDLSGDEPLVLKSFDAPPQKRGTIRGIAWDGSNIWAANSGSTTYGTPPTLYKLNPADGSILSEYVLPTLEPRGLTYFPGYKDVYGKGADAGIYYTDITKDKIYFFSPQRPLFDSVFSAPQPPRGKSFIYPTGLANDGQWFWLINSSDVADHLYKLNSLGKENGRYDLPYEYPGSVVWSQVDVRTGAALSIIAVNPNQATQGDTLKVEVMGTGFKPGTALKVAFGDGITTGTPGYVSQSLLQVDLYVSSTAVIGKRTVTVTNPDGKSVQGPQMFEVTKLKSDSYLWITEQDGDSLYKIKITDGTIVSKWDTKVIGPAGSPQGLAFDGTNLWLSTSGTDRKIYKIDTTKPNLTKLAELPAPTTQGTLRGICWEANYLWLSISAVGTTGKIYRLDPGTGMALDSINSPGLEPRGITFVNGKLYCNDKDLDSVYVYNISTQKWASVFQTPVPPGGASADKFATGLTWDGSNFWIANSTGNFDHVFKVSPTGVVLLSFPAPRIGSAQLTGLVYISN